jgi:hypothetical protein
MSIEEGNFGKIHFRVVILKLNLDAISLGLASSCLQEMIGSQGM